MTRSDRLGGLLGVCLLMIVLIEDTKGGGVFEIEFLDYEDDCSEGGGYCDALFYFSVGTPSCGRCYDSHSPREDDYFQANRINLQAKGSIQGLPNPWKVSVSSFESYVRVTVKVTDADTGDDDDMVTFTLDIANSVGPSDQWLENSVSRTEDGYHYRLKYRYKMYCDKDYYSSRCDTYCVSTNSLMGHYTCNTNDGSKICSKGWHGVNCEVDIDECSEKICSNGICKNLPGSAQCICDTFHTGSDCSQILNHCDSHPCQNGGACFMHPTEPRHVCTCQATYTGLNCETKIVPCIANPCLNHGTCFNHPTENSRVCSCTSDWQGPNCETAVDICSKQICLNGGTCAVISTQHTPICVCTPGWQGSDCGSRVNPCTTLPCLNGGTCIAELDYSSYTCECPDEYSGAHCQHSRFATTPLIVVG